MRLTLASFKTWANFHELLNMDVSDPRWLQYLNSALLRLMAPGKWVGTTGRYAVCVNSGCLCWPRSFETIEAMDICNTPVALRNQWFEFLENGPGLQKVNGCAPWNSIDRGSGYAMFDDLFTNSIIRLYPQYVADAGKTVTIRGTDLNGNEVLTDGGDTQGEVMTIASPYVDSTTIWSPQVFREVIKQVTKGYVRAYAYDATLTPPPASPGPTDTPLKALAVWEPTETLPDYRRSFIPVIPNMKNCNTCCGLGTSTSDKVTITVIAKHRFIPIENDLDFLPLGNPEAIALAMKSVMLEKRNDFDGAKIAMQGMFDPIRRRYFNGAIPLLEEELASWQGDGTSIVIRRDPNYVGGAAVTNFI